MSLIMEKIIPDFREIAEILTGMRSQHLEDTAHLEDETKTSVRNSPLSFLTSFLRSLLVLLGVLYRYQKRTKTRELEDSSSSLPNELCQEQL